jgi:hypothetical protein
MRALYRARGKQSKGAKAAGTFLRVSLVYSNTFYLNCERIPSFSMPATRPTHRRSAPYSTRILSLSETSPSSAKTMSFLESLLSGG